MSQNCTLIRHFQLVVNLDVSSTFKVHLLRVVIWYPFLGGLRHFLSEIKPSLEVTGLLKLPRLEFSPSFLKAFVYTIPDESTLGLAITEDVK